MFSQKRSVAFSVIIAGLVFVLACQSITKVFPTGLSSTSTDYEGNWMGTTTQGLEITFTVAHNEIISMQFQIEWEGVNCKQTIDTGMETMIDPTAEAAGNFTPINPITNGTFTISHDNSKVDGTIYTFTGTFLSFDEASGTIQYAVTRGSCQGTKQFKWNATKISN